MIDLSKLSLKELNKLHNEIGIELVKRTIFKLKFPDERLYGEILWEKPWISKVLNFSPLKVEDGIYDEDCQELMVKAGPYDLIMYGQFCVSDPSKSVKLYGSIGASGKTIHPMGKSEAKKYWEREHKPPRVV